MTIKTLMGLGSQVHYLKSTMHHCVMYIFLRHLSSMRATMMWKCKHLLMLLGYCMIEEGKTAVVVMRWREQISLVICLAF